jgi:hypothetical protein
LFFRCPNVARAQHRRQQPGAEIRRAADKGSSQPTLEHQMSRLAEFRKFEQQLASQLAELETMKGDAA